MDILPRVSSIPSIYAKDMEGFEDWICSQIGPHTCCTKAKRKYYAESADLGTDIHALREAFLRGESFSEGVPEYQAQLFDPIARFYKETGYEPIDIEDQLNGKELTGKPDGCGKFKTEFWLKERKTFWQQPPEGYLGLTVGKDVLPTLDSVWLDDLKVKSKLDPLHPLQLYGYSLLLKETKDINVSWGLIIRRNKDVNKRPELQLRAYYLPAYAKLWEASVLAWRFLNG